ncbi:hypothetical protein EDB85DRAFT_1902345 [Lactarius pseudohatsudake]|nr:hypothetical protein EDB85DRAFT_1902345 [Lactarius pseudohatsudake]
MDDYQVDLSLVEPMLLFSPVEGDTPYPREAKSQPRVPNLPPFAHTRAGVLQNSCQNYSEVAQVYPRRFCLQVESVFGGSTYEYTASPLDGGNLNIRSTGGDAAGHFDSLTSTAYLGRLTEMAVCSKHSPRFCECASVGLFVPNNVPATYTDHPDEGSTTGFRYDGETVDVPSSQRCRREFSGNLRPSTENRSSDYSFVLPQGTLQGQEPQSPVSVDKRVFDLSSSFLPRETSDSLETQDQYLGERPAIRHRGRYLCEICGDGFAQPQGVRRHHLEKHNPRTCPHCHTFKWGRLYLFKKHLREAHPHEDTEPATLDTAKGGHRKGLTANRARIHSSPTLRVHHRRNRRGDTTQRQMTLSPFAGPGPQPASSLKPQAKTFSIIDNDARDEACVICETWTGSGCLSTAAPRP